MKIKLFLIAMLSITCLPLLQGCSDNNDEDLGSNTSKSYEFSKNNLVVESAGQDLEIGIPNYKDVGLWFVDWVIVSDGAGEQCFVNDVATVEDIDKAGSFSKYCFETTRKNEGAILDLKVKENTTGAKRNIKVKIRNGWSGSGYLMITQKAGK